MKKGSVGEALFSAIYRDKLGKRTLGVMMGKGGWLPGSVPNSPFYFLLVDIALVSTG